MKRKLRIMNVAAEVAPYAKTGGLADVVHALPKELVHQGHSVSIIMPCYGFMKKQNIPMTEVDRFRISVGSKNFGATIYQTEFSPGLTIYFVANHELFGRSRLYGYPNDNTRFMFFCKAVVRFIKEMNNRPHVVHCHDWHTGLIPNYLKQKFNHDPSLRSIATLYTIHNLPFQFGSDWWKVPPKQQDDGRGVPPETPTKKLNRVNFAKRALLNADIINTVSERYAEEILTPEFGQDLDGILRRREEDVYGIVNGIDYTVYNPVYDKNIPVNYDWNQLDKKQLNKNALQRKVGLEQKADIPLIGVVNRLSEQKGFNLLREIAYVLVKLPLQLVIVGSGHPDYVRFFKRLAKKYPKRIGFYSPFTEELASLTYAGSDMFLMPSRYEPCGISQMISLRYGSIPIVRETGGLSDTITNFNPKTQKGIGFVFSGYTKEDFLIAIVRALETYRYAQVWEHLTWRAMKTSYSWEVPAKKYAQLYRLAYRHKRARKKGTT
ncbi:MAG: glycogen synthase [Candidatus Nomurabacteria bacterium]|nr:MAG: glycogen synthase [Candidatus Nomurabacteria bacterium]